MAKLIKLPGGNVTKMTAEAEVRSLPEVLVIVGQFTTRPPEKPAPPFQAQSMKEFMEKMQFQLVVPCQSEPIPIRDPEDLSKDRLIEQVTVLSQDRMRREALTKLQNAIFDPNNYSFHQDLAEIFSKPGLKEKRITQLQIMRQNYRDPEFLQAESSPSL